MSKKRSIYEPFKNARASLFDRLVDFEPNNRTQVSTVKTLSRQELKDSIQKEIHWLLNTRCEFPMEALKDQERDTLNYGTPSFTSFFPADPGTRKKLSEEIQTLITTYEPRLKNVEVLLKDEEQKTDYFSLKILIVADLVVDEISEPVQFLMQVA